jgi:hypothetical protein
LWNSNSWISFWWESPGGLSAATEEYDGTSWTSNPTGLNTARLAPAGVGTQTAALAFGGDTPPVTTVTEEYDGSTWTIILGFKYSKKRFNRCWNPNSSFSFWW